MIEITYYAWSLGVKADFWQQDVIIEHRYQPKHTVQQQELSFVHEKASLHFLVQRGGFFELSK